MLLMYRSVSKVVFVIGLKNVKLNPIDRLTGSLQSPYLRVGAAGPNGSIVNS